MQKIRNIYFKGKKRINAGFEDDLMASGSDGRIRSLSGEFSLFPKCNNNKENITVERKVVEYRKNKVIISFD